MPANDTAPVCLIAESAPAASRAASMFADDVPQVLLNRPGWHASLGPYTNGDVAVVLEDGATLPELVALAQELVRFQSVELIYDRDFDLDRLADLISLYEAAGLKARPSSERAAGIRITPLVPNSRSGRSPNSRQSGIVQGSVLGGWARNLRVGFLGPSAWRLLGSAVRGNRIDPSWRGELANRFDGWLNLLLVDASSDIDDEAIRDLRLEAQAMGAAVVRAFRGAKPASESSAGYDLDVDAISANWVNPALISPFGYRWVVDGRFGVVGSLRGGSTGVEEGLGLVEELASAGGVDVFGTVRGVRLPEGVRVFGGEFGPDQIAQLRPYAGVVDHSSFHETTENRAEVLVGLAAAGVPVVAVDIDETLERLIGSELTGVLTSGTPSDLKDPDTRDRLSVRLRRLGLSDGSQVTRWRDILGPLGLAVEPPPTVSVVLTTNRPDYLQHALDQIKSQTYPETELVLVLHGDAFTHSDDQLADLYGSSLTIERVPSKNLFGEALNRGVAASTGTLIAKMDDDDWYSPHHLWDLVRAMDYSGADLVGKAAEFVYLEELDITIRRMVQGSETYGNRNLGGGTFLIKRTTLNTIGGWRRAQNSGSEDQGAIEDVLRAGGLVYRTSGHGYLLARRAQGHTWDMTSAYFTEMASTQKSGLALEWAVI